ncbi:MAG: tandem-95 repeat protein, partial [Bacteroidales bacterium]|nr:tandem-95 repeat protein [Bacteroidales bacterium]
SASGGTGSLTYTWADGPTGATRSNLFAGSYTVTVADANSCEEVRTYTITEPADFSVNVAVTDASCKSTPDGSINLTVSGAVSPYTFIWSNSATTEDILNLGVGAYAVTITDANSCQEVVTNIQVDEPDSLILLVTNNNNVTCKGGSDGSATATPTGGTSPYSYLWSNGSTLQTPVNFSAGSYTVVLTDANGCTADTTITITEPALEIELYTVVRNTSWCSASTGAIDLIVVNGGTSFNYIWSPGGATSQDISGLTAGNYSVTVTDNLGCQAVLSNITVGTAPAMTVSVNTIDRNCVAANGEAYAVVTGGVPPYTYVWSPGAATTDFITGLDVGPYSVTVTDADLCTANNSGTVSIPTCIPPVAVNDTFTTCGDTVTGSVALNDTPDYTVVDLEFLPLIFPLGSEGQLLWDTAYDGSFAFVPAAGFTGKVSMKYQVETEQGLIDTARIIIYASAIIPDILAGNTSHDSCGLSNGAATVSLTGGFSPISYLWSTTSNTATTTGLSTGMYYVSITDSIGCTVEDSVLIQNICLTIVKELDSVNGDPAKTKFDDVGDRLTYRIIVSNTGTATLTGVNVTDAMTSLNITIPSLAAGAKDTIYTEYFVQNTDMSLDSIINVAFANFTYNGKDYEYQDRESVAKGNLPPVALNDINNTLINTPVPGNVLTNDSDPNGDPITLNTTPVTPPSNGIVTLNPNGSYLYTPDPGFTGVDTFSYVICDNATVPLCDTADVIITVIPIIITAGNSPPIAIDDSYQGTINNPILGYVIANDWDPDFNLNFNSVTLVDPGTTAANGTLALNADGTFTYTPNIGFSGQVWFTYNLCDLGVPIYCDNARVTIDIYANPLGLNTTYATDDSYLTGEDIPITGNVLSNDVDPESDNQLVNPIPIVNVSNGSLVLNTNGSFTYTPATNYSGPDQFVYAVCDDGTPQACDTATVYLLMTPLNDPPVAINDINNTLINTPVLGDVSPNDYDPEGDPLIWTTTPVTPPVNGNITLFADGSYIYTPDLGFTGEDSLEYQVCDPEPLCATAWLYITVIGPPVGGNRPPVANEDAYEGIEDTPVYGQILSNDYDPDKDNIILNTTPLDNVNNGTLVLNANGTFTYTPNSGFTGEDYFRYEICDDGVPSLCDTTIVTITIEPDAGQNTTDAADDVYATTKNVPISRNISLNDYDAEGDNQNSFTVISGPSDGSLTAFNGLTGAFTYTPDAGYTGPDQFVYVVCDDGSPTACDTATVYLMVLPQGPVAISDFNVTTVNTPVGGDVTPNDYDRDGDMLTVSTTPLLPPSAGSVSLNSDGSYVYTPNNGYTGRDLFIYEVCDEDGLCDTAFVFINIVDHDVTGNNPPVANSDHYEGVENTPINGQMLPNDYDP